MAEEDPNIEPRRLADDHAGEIADLRRQVAELRQRENASRSGGQGAKPGTPPGDKQLETRVAKLEAFIAALNGQNGITVSGPIISLDPIKATWNIVCNADGSMSGTLTIP